jgi:hypothetical protein
LWAASFVKVNDWLFWEQSVLPATALTTYLNATMGAVD